MEDKFPKPRGGAPASHRTMQVEGADGEVAVQRVTAEGENDGEDTGFALIHHTAVYAFVTGVAIGTMLLVCIIVRHRVRERVKTS